MATTREAKLRISVEGNAQSELRRLSETTRKINGASSQAAAGLGKAEKATKGLNAQAQKGVRAWSAAARSQKTWATAVKNSTSRIAENTRQVERLASVKTKLEKIDRQHANTTKRLTENVKQLAKAEERAARARGGRGGRGGGGGIGRIGRGFGGAALSGVAAIPGLGFLAGAATAAGAAALAVGGVSMGLAASVREASKLDSAMSRVRAVSMASRREMTELRSQAASLGANTVFDAAQVGAVQENLLRAGFSSSETQAAVPAALAYASASGTDAAFSASAIAQSVRALGFDASQASDVADVFTVASTSSNVDAGTLAETLKYAAPVFASMGQGEQRVALEDVTALAGILGDKGIQGSMAGTALRAGYGALSSPTKKARDTLRGLRVDTEDDDGNVRRLPEILSDLRDSLEGKGTAEQQKALGSIFGIRNAGTFAAILDTSPERFDSLIRAMRDSSDAAERTARIMQDDLAGDLEELSGSLGGLGTTIGGHMMPSVRASVQSISDFVDMIHDATEAADVGSAIFGSAGNSIEAITDGFLEFASEAAPKVMRALETFGVIEDGSALRFAEEMANARTEVATRRAERLGQRELDQLTNEGVRERGRLQGVEGAIGAAKGSTGAMFARDVRRRLADSGLGELAEENPEVAQILAEAEQVESFGGRRGEDARRGLIERLQGVIVPIAEQRLAQSEESLEGQKGQIRSRTQSAISAIESQRGALKADTTADAMTDVERLGLGGHLMNAAGDTLNRFAGPLSWAGVYSPGDFLKERAESGGIQKSGVGERIVETLSALREDLKTFAAPSGRATNGAD